jgi:hypothetical protein
MGWSFHYQKMSAKEHVASILNSWNTSEHASVIAHKSIGRTLWLVVATFASHPDKEKMRLIVAVLRDKQDGQWGEKEVSEDMGPCEVNCPLKFLELAPGDAGSYSGDWRKRVIAYHNQPKPKVGDKYTIGEHDYQLILTKPWRVKRLSDGQIFRAGPRVLARATKIV